jgi:hypothetical protein
MSETSPRGTLEKPSKVCSRIQIVVEVVVEVVVVVVVVQHKNDKFLFLQKS